MAKYKDELIKKQEEDQAYKNKTLDKLYQKQKDLDNVQDEMSAISLREDELMRKEEVLKDEIRGLKQELHLDEKELSLTEAKLKDIDNLFTEARKSDADWDYDNDKQQLN